MATITLRKVPETELEHLLMEQLKNKLAKDRKLYSLESTLYKIIREHKEFKTKK